jgi:hypothetical protein
MVGTIDVSRVVWLRKRLSRAKPAIKVAGVAVALGIVGKAFRLSLSGLAPWLAVIFAGLVLWGAKRLAGGLKKGRKVAAKLLMLLFVPYVVGAAYVTVNLALQVKNLRGLALVPFGEVLFFSLWVGPIYFIVRGLLAFLAIDRLPSDAFASAQLPSPFESGVKVLRPPAFPKKGCGVAFFFLFLVALGQWFLVFLGFELFVLPLFPVSVALLLLLCFALFFQAPLLFICAIVYRVMRRLAVASSTDMLRTHDRPPVLYLRSFGDDTFKLRARSTNGRIWLKALWRLRFEEVLVDHMFRYGPVVAIGRPLPSAYGNGEVARHTAFRASYRPVTGDISGTPRRRQDAGKNQRMARKRLSKSW